MYFITSETINGRDCYKITWILSGETAWYDKENGTMLKRIGTYAREDLEKMLDIKINLKLWVKVKEDWLNNDNFVNKFKQKCER